PGHGRPALPAAATGTRRTCRAGRADWTRRTSAGSLGRVPAGGQPPAASTPADHALGPGRPDRCAVPADPGHDDLAVHRPAVRQARLLPPDGTGTGRAALGRLAVTAGRAAARPGSGNRCRRQSLLAG